MENTPKLTPGSVSILVVGFILLCGLLFGSCYGLRSVDRHFDRYQLIQDANNQIQLNELVAKQTKQLIENERQKAQIRIEEARGIAEAQKLINATLTNQYLQHEAIEAQKGMANSQNHTQIYIPVGTNGLPLVKNVD